MADKMDIKLKKCTTPEGRVSFPQVFAAKAFKEGDDEKFSITLLFERTQDLKELKRAADNALTEKYGDKAKWPKNLRMPFRNGDEMETDGYTGKIFIRATSKERPTVVNQGTVGEDGKPAFTRLTSEQEFYAGCYARATLIAFAYDHKGNRGVAFSLQNVQKLRDGKKFSGKKAAEEEFTVVEDTSENAENYGGSPADGEATNSMGF